MQSESEYINEGRIIRSLNRFFCAFKNAMSSRVFFFTRSGLIGLAPSAAKENDLLCIFFGGKTPFLIREMEKGFQLIGECYVHGIMDGEAMDGYIFGIYQVQDFWLS
jgi:hypothetical protein